MPISAVDIQLTPTARLARSLAREHALAQSNAGQTAWLPSPIATFSTWVAQLREQYLLLADDDRIPISAQQAQVIWQDLIEDDVFIGEPQVASLALGAWRTLHEYRLPAPEQWPPLALSEDNRRFQAWCVAYDSVCRKRGLLDEWHFASALPEFLTSGQVEAPRSIELVGFDLPLTPLKEAIIAACQSAGTRVTRAEADAGGHAEQALEVLECRTADDELFAAAHWARQRLEEDASQSIAIVVTDLAGRVDRVERIFRQVMDPPGFCLKQNDAEPWHLSLGKPLADWPLIADALSILALNTYRMTQPQLGQLLRSPYFAGSDEEALQRQQALTRLIRFAPYELTTNEIGWALQQHQADLLMQQLEAWQGVKREAADNLWPSQWTGQWQAELSSIGFASGRGLNSREYQILKRWHDLLEAFASLDLVMGTPIPRERALALLRDRAANTVFRERNPGVPIEILGVEEALGSRCDALWITTLDSENWPGSVRREALIPAILQSNVPRATSEGAVHHATLELHALLQTAPLCRGSYSRGTDEAANEFTALLGECVVTPMPPPPPVTAAEMETLEADAEAPIYAAVDARGGTAVLRHQSACPFRAFAQHRLNAIELVPPRPGLNAGDRGTITHKALENFWRGLQGSDALLSMSESQQQARVRGAVEQALNHFTRDFRLSLSATGRVLEQRRTERVVQRWLALERQRSSFDVVAQEYEIDIELAGIRLHGTLDRLDELQDGSLLLLDYKTGRCNKADWFPQARIIDPQLPTYAVSMVPSPRAIGFAQIRPDALGFAGLAENDSGTPGIGNLADEKYAFKSLDSWDELLSQWRSLVEALGEEFTAGSAAVDPRHPQECNQCHLQSLCRVLERAPFDSLAVEQEDE